MCAALPLTMERTMNRFGRTIDTPTSRRNVLRGSVLAGAAARDRRGVAFAMPRRAPVRDSAGPMPPRRIFTRPQNR